jgi:glycosyltransferase involved in cell wall biosynthesis
MGKTIAVDISSAEGSPAGIGLLARNLVENLIRLDHQNRYILYSTKPLRWQLASNVENIVVSFPKAHPLKGLRWMLSVAGNAKKKKADLLLALSGQAFTLFFPRTVLMVHDLGPLAAPEYYPLKTILNYKLFFRLYLSKAYRIMTIADAIKEELIKKCRIKAAKITVVNESINTHILDMKPLPEKLALPPKFIMSLSTIQPRKNYYNMVKAFHLLKQVPAYRDLKYVIIGNKGWMYEQVFKEIADLRLGEDVLLLNYVPDEYLGHYYKNALAFLYVSFYEGFGIPPLEAMNFGCSCVLGDIPVLKESFGKFARFADPDDPQAIFRETKAILDKKERFTKQKELNKIFNWPNCAGQALNLINHA